MTKYLRLLVYSFSLFAGLHACISWYRIISTTAPDFSVYYYSTVRLIQGLSIYGDTGLFTGLGYPPQSLLFYVPFTFFPYQIAQALWITASFCSIPIIVWLTFRLIGRVFFLEHFFLLTSLFFLSFPAKFTLGMGQVNLIALAFLLAGSVFSKQLLLSGVYIGLAILLKPQLIFFLCILLIFKKYKQTGIAVLFNVLAVGIIFLLGQGNLVFQYVAVESVSLARFVERGIYYNQGISGMLSRIVSDPLAKTGVHIIRVLLIAPLLYYMARQRVRFHEGILYGLLLILLGLPVVWQHHIVFLFPVYVWLWYRTKHTSARYVLFMSILLVSMNIKHPERVLFFPQIILSHAFIGMLLLWGLCLKALKERS